MRNVILIGMPGCGKSTVGVLAAKALTMDFVDTDLLLQRKAGRPLQRMVDELGAEGFAHVEEACVCGLEARGAVIATGGSVATEDAAMEHLKEGGLVIFLRLPLETLSRRLKNMKTRGIAMEKGQTLRDLYERRQPAYLKWADAVVDAEGLGVEETVARVVAAVREREGQTQETEAEKAGKQNEYRKKAGRAGRGGCFSGAARFGMSEKSGGCGKKGSGFAHKHPLGRVGGPPRVSGSGPCR